MRRYSSLPSSGYVLFSFPLSSQPFYGYEGYELDIASINDYWMST